MADFVIETARVHADLKAVLEPTPLQYNQYLSDLHDADIWLKREDLSPVRSYKIRGAYTFFNEYLKQDNSIEHFVCASAGVLVACAKIA